MEVIRSKTALAEQYKLRVRMRRYQEEQARRV